MEKKKKEIQLEEENGEGSAAVGMQSESQVNQKAQKLDSQSAEIHKATLNENKKSKKSAKSNVQNGEKHSELPKNTNANTSFNAILQEGGLEKEDLKIKRAKGSKNISVGVCHIAATFNNTKVVFTDQKGNVVSWSSAGCKFKNSHKSTAYAGQIAATEAAKKAMGHGVREVSIEVKGPGLGRDTAIRALQSVGLSVSSIRDVTPIPHNGCRPPKRRRV